MMCLDRPYHGTKAQELYAPVFMPPPGGLWCGADGTCHRLSCTSYNPEMVLGSAEHVKDQKVMGDSNAGAILEGGR